MTQNEHTQTLLEYAETLEWKPIETAPHNCNIFVKYKNCADKDRIVKACFYEAGTLQAHDDYDGDDVDDNGYMTTSKWYEECENQPEGFIYELEETPDHWMPIPTGNAGAVIKELLEGLAMAYNKLYILHHTEWAVDRLCKRDCEKGFIATQQALAKAAALVGGTGNE